MKTLHYSLQFFDYWHTGSGLSAGTYADQVVNKTHDGFPFVPGKTIKGLLRHAAEDLLELGDEAFKQSTIEQIFGTRAEGRHEVRGEEDAFPPDNARQGGIGWFSNANLSPVLRAKLNKQPERARLFEVLASTAIDETGTAENHTLRQMEVAIPMTLHGRISGLEEQHRATLERFLHYVKRLGQNRSRGLGRCQFKITAK
jgi:CRISPR/Cas system CSM-associated protein Csm3 (group 7 of RAMP superfamily)